MLTRWGNRFFGFSAFLCILLDFMNFADITFLIDFVYCDTGSEGDIWILSETE